MLPSGYRHLAFSPLSLQGKPGRPNIVKHCLRCPGPAAADHPGTEQSPDAKLHLRLVGTIALGNSPGKRNWEVGADGAAELAGQPVSGKVLGLLSGPGVHQPGGEVHWAHLSCRRPAHPAGLGKNVPPAARFVVFLNKCDTDDSRDQAVRLASAIVCAAGSPCRHAVVGSLRQGIYLSIQA
jgi:hypothetical protein